MTFKKSIYNVEVQEDNTVILLNTVTGSILISSELDELKSILCTSSDEYLSQLKKKKYEKLIQNGFLVNENEDEKQVAELRYYDKLFDNTLKLTLLPTEQCNFRCVYCYEKFINPSMSHDVKNGIIEFVKKNISKYSSVNVNWFGGEPLMNLDGVLFLSEEIINICKNYHKPYYANMTTNGYLLNLETFRKLLKMKVTHFQITIDGTKEHHDATRVLSNKDSTFDNIIKNLIDIKENVKSQIFTIAIRCNLTKESFEDLENYLKFMSETFGDDRRFTFYFRPAGEWSGSKINNLNLIDNNLGIYESLLKSKYKLNYKAYKDILLSQECGSAKRNHLIVRSNGQICKCTVYLDESIIGNIDEKGNIALQASKQAKWILPKKDNYNECSNCLFSANCHGYSCPANKFSKTKKSKDCGYEVSHFEEVLKLVTIKNKFMEFSKIIDFDCIKE